MDRKKWLILGVLLGLAVSVGLGLVWFNLKSNRSRGGADSKTITLDGALEDWNAERYAQAFAKFKALTQDPARQGDPQVHYEFGRAAEVLDRLDEADKAFQKAWTLGKQDRETLMARWRVNPDWSEAKRASNALQWLNEVKQPQQKQALHAEILFSTGQFVESRQKWLELWDQLAGKNPDPEWVTRTAMAFAAEREYLLGANWLESVLIQNSKNSDPETYSLLATFYALGANPSSAEQALEKGLVVFPDHPLLTLRSAELAFSVGDYKKSAQVLKDFLPTEETATQQPAATLIDPELARRGRLLYYLTLEVDNNQREKRPNDVSWSWTEDSPRAEGERAFFEAIQMDPNARTTSSKHRELLEKASSLLPEEPAPNFLYARELIQLKENQEALIRLDRSRNPILEFWGPWAKTRAEALKNLGRNWAASEIINRLHARGFHTQQSLNLSLEIQEALMDRTNAAKTRLLIQSEYGATPEFRFSEALESLNSGQFSEAANRLKSLASEFPDEYRFAYQLGRALILSGDLKSAMEIARNSTSLSKAQSSLLMGQAEAVAGNSDAAKKHFIQAFETNPSQETGVNALIFLLTLKDLKTAEPIISRSISLFPTQLWPNLSRAVWLEASGSIPEAIELSESLMAKFPDSVEVAALLARLYSSTGAWTTTRRWATEALRISQGASPIRTGLAPSDKTDLQAWLGAAILNEGAPASAKGPLESAVNENPNHRLGLHALASCEFALKNYSSAIRRLQHLRKISPEDWTADDTVLQIRCLEMLEDFESARNLLKQDRPLLGNAAILLEAGIEETSGNVETALNLLSNPPAGADLSVFERNWIFTQFRSGSVSAGWEKAQGANYLIPSDWTALAAIAINREENDIAINSLNRRVQVEPSDALARNNLAYLLLKRNQPSDLPNAATQAGEALKISPDDSAIVDTLARIYLEQKQADAAGKLIQPWLEKDFSNPLWPYLQARIHLLNNEIESAREQLERAQSIWLSEASGVTKEEIDQWMTQLESI